MLTYRRCFVVLFSTVIGCSPEVSLQTEDTDAIDAEVQSRDGGRSDAGTRLDAGSGAGGGTGGTGGAGTGGGLESISPVSTCTLPPMTGFGLVPSSDRANDIPFVVTDRGTMYVNLARPSPDGGAHPLIIFIHGGGWVGGTRGEHVDSMLRAASMGFVGATIDYRTGANSFPGNLQDVRCAIRFLKAHASSLQLPGGGSFNPTIDKKRVGLDGTSAGAHLAALAGTSWNSASAAGELDLDGPFCDPALMAESVEVQAVSSHSAPTDLVNHGMSESKNMIGTPAAPGETELASPLYQVSKGDGPFLIMQGLLDTLVVPLHGQLLKQALNQAGEAATLYEVNGGHNNPRVFDTGEPGKNGPLPDPASYRTGGCTEKAFFEKYLTP